MSKVTRLAVDVPVLETARLVLRAHRPADLTACAAMWADPKVVRFIGLEPSSRQQTWARMLTYAGLWATFGFGYWAVEERTSGRLVGEVGFADFRRDLQPSIDGIPEAGWVFVTAVHGRGYATEAVAAAIAWADQRFTRTVCIISPGHKASIRVAEKVGYRELGPALYKSETTLLMARDRAALA
jgi:RimJ/RimL family protein N-acetyltransferase